MLDRSILDLVDDVVSKIDAPASKKIQIENELIRHLVENAENSSMDEVRNSLSAKEPHHPPKPNPMYVGEFMQELNHLNLKLLYIPLIQITSRTSRLIMPLANDDYY
jgi:hypothetical protein